MGLRQGFMRPGLPAGPRFQGALPGHFRMQTGLRNQAGREDWTLPLHAAHGAWRTVPRRSAAGWHLLPAVDPVRAGAEFAGQTDQLHHLHGDCDDRAFAGRLMRSGALELHQSGALVAATFDLHVRPSRQAGRKRQLRRLPHGRAHGGGIVVSQRGQGQARPA